MTITAAMIAVPLLATLPADLAAWIAVRANSCNLVMHRRVAVASAIRRAWNAT